MSWLYYGKSFEAMVSMIEKQMKNPKADNADRLGCSLVVKQIINVSIRNGFRTRADWDRYFAMNSAIEKGNVGEWALQTITADMETDEESRDTITTRTEDSVRGPVVQRVAGKKKSRNGHSPIILITRTRKLYYNISATLFPSIQVPFIKHYRSMY